uniref:Uncharacterized protein n=1 Tax=Arundo donax TaxID=35708 RepID=A0A0A8Y657_ARUDO
MVPLIDPSHRYCGMLHVLGVSLPLVTIDQSSLVAVVTSKAVMFQCQTK